MLQVSDPKGGSSAEVAELNFLLGEMFAASANQLLKAAGVPAESVDLIGSHGQTISHIPPRTEGTVFQLGSTLNWANRR